LDECCFSKRLPIVLMRVWGLSCAGFAESFFSHGRFVYSTLSRFVVLSTLSLGCESPDNDLQQLNWKSVGIGELVRGSDICSGDGSLMISNPSEFVSPCREDCHCHSSPLDLDTACFRSIPDTVDGLSSPLDEFASIWSA
jgi:hypothetical protein